MEFIKLKSGNKMPVLGLGTWELTGRLCADVVKSALKMGYDLIDTAAAYENHKDIGNAIKNSDRSGLFITSKVWRDNLDYYDVIRSCKNILADLGTDYLDLLLIHWPNRDIPIDQTISAMAELYSQEKIKSFGVSNFTVAHLNEALAFAEKESIPLCVNQVEFHPYLNQKDLLDFCKENNIAVTAYSPLARGRILTDPLLKEIGKRHSRSPAQIAVRWVLQKGMTTVPKASSEGHLRQNMDVFNFMLSDDEIGDIDKLNRDERFVDPDFSEFDRAE